MDPQLADWVGGSVLLDLLGELLVVGVGLQLPFVVGILEGESHLRQVSQFCKR